MPSEPIRTLETVMRELVDALVVNLHDEDIGIGAYIHGVAGSQRWDRKHFRCPDGNKAPLKDCVAAKLLRSIIEKTIKGEDVEGKLAAAILGEREG